MACGPVHVQQRLTHEAPDSADAPGSNSNNFDLSWQARGTLVCVNGRCRCLQSDVTFEQGPTAGEAAKPQSLPERRTVG